MAKKAAAKKTKSIEESLWDAANKLRGKVESSEYKHVVLGLIFLKFTSDKFEKRKQELIADGKEKYIDMVEFYAMQNVFYLAPESRWSYIMENAKQDDIALKIDTALFTVEKNNPSLKGALPDNYFSRLNMDASKLSALLDTVNNIDTITDTEEDIVGRVYEYFLGKFAASEGKGGGEFYTPKSVVKLIADMLEPYKGKIYDPACGSGGMFVQSIKFIESHNGNKKDISIYGQEYTATTYKLAKMNLAIRGISANLGDVPADTFFKDQHPDLKADFIMANPPFNQKGWRAENELTDDPRWRGYDVPPTGNANYAWILNMISKLSENGTAGFVLANGSMSSNTSGEGELRKKFIENDLVDCMIALPGQLFYTTQIPVCLWFMTKNKKATTEFRDRQGETLFIDARNMGTMLDRTHKELTEEDLAEISSTYHNWRNKPSSPPFKEEYPQGEVVKNTSRTPQGEVVKNTTSTSQRDEVEKLNNLPHLKTFRKELRNNLTPAEAKLWTALKGKQLEGRKFRRQHSVGNYILDFYCPSERIAIELDGEIHNDATQAEYDKERDLFLEHCGIKVLRFENKLVFEQGNMLLEKVKQEFGWVSNHPALQAPLLENEGSGSSYNDVPGFCKSATLEEIAKNDYVLTPGRYVGIAEEEDDGIPFEEKMTELSQSLFAQMEEAEKLDATIRENLKVLGYE